MAEKLILGLPNRDELIDEIEQHMRPGELVLAAESGPWRNVRVSQMNADRLVSSEDGRDLIIAPSPVYTNAWIMHSPDTRVERKDKPITLRDGVRVDLTEKLAIGNKAVFEMINYLGFNSASDDNMFKRGFLWIFNHLGIKKGEGLDKIKADVASDLVEKLVKNVPEAVQFALQATESVIEGNHTVIYAPLKHTPEEINNFVGLIGRVIGRDNVLSSLRWLVDTGVYGSNLEVEVEQEGRKSLINVDEYFRHLATYFEPQFTPRTIPKSRWTY